MCMDFPSRWRLATLSEVCDIELGQSPPSDTYNSVGLGLPFYQGKAEFGEIHPTPVKWCSDPKKIANAGDILISVRAPVGPVNICQETSCIGRGLAAIQPKNGMIGKYVFYYLKLIEKEWDSKATGTTFKAITGSVIRKQQIPVAPTEDQEKIVTKIEELFSQLDAATAALKRVQANLKRYKSSVLKAACEGRLVPTEAELARREGRSYESGAELLERILKERRRRWEEEQRAKGKDPAKMKYPEPARPDTEGLTELPEGWCWATVEQVCFLDVGFAFKSNEFEDRGVKLLRGDNIQPGILRWDDTRFWPEKKIAPYKHLLIDEGDIILAMDRPIITSGLKLARAKKQDLPCLLVQRMARFRFVFEPLSDYLYVSLQTDHFVKHLMGSQTGTQLPHISARNIYSYQFPLPPLAEQKRISEEIEKHLSIIDLLYSNIETDLKRIFGMRQAILRQCFLEESSMRLELL